MDSRFYLKIDFTIYGQEFKWDCSLNWTAEPGEIDDRIKGWFLDCHDEAYAKWQDEIHRRQAEQRAEEERKLEISELKRLRAKYPTE